jgi:hypothetical protein
MRVNRQRDSPDLPQLTIDIIPLETISSHKLLGLQIQDDLGLFHTSHYRRI